MAEPNISITSFDPTWAMMVKEAEEAVCSEPALGGFFHTSVLHHDTLDEAIAARIATKMASADLSEPILRDMVTRAFKRDESLGRAARADLMAVYERDPACHRLLQAFLYFKGFQALQTYRVAHWLWTQKRCDLAYYMQMRMSELYSVDIHPAAKIGQGIMMDHGHSIVIGETAQVADNVSILHGVTLGGTGKEDGDRHPKIGHGVMIGAGAKILGNIQIGCCSRIAAGSVVLHDMPPGKTVAGVPAKIVGEAGCDQPSVKMDQVIG